VWRVDEGSACVDIRPSPKTDVLLCVFCCRVFSGYIKEVDEKPSATSWGAKMTFANLMAEHSNGGGGQLYLFLYY